MESTGTINILPEFSNKPVDSLPNQRPDHFIKDKSGWQGLGGRPKASVVHLFLLITLFLLIPLGPAWGAEKNKIENIDVVTPQWEAQTNADGTGLFFEIVQRVYEPLGIKMNYKLVPWKRALKMVSSKKADAMLCVWKQDASEQGHLIPNFPLFVEYTGVVFKKSRITSWRGLKTLDGKSAVWLRGYDFHTVPQLAAISIKNWTEVDDYDRAWLLLANDRYDVYIDALIDLENYIATKPVDMALYQMEVLWGENTYVAFAPTEKSRLLIDIYDSRIRVLFKTGELQKIYEKWGVRFSPEPWQSEMEVSGK